ncbi:hypothetical protein [Actinoplanes sp. URMC 104]|uniref:hypothetical protein n=1 Tax=Actinoplanes sp. URMC 104 TaxID=3423409 RepID=UPI003F1AB6B0
MEAASGTEARSVGEAASVKKAGPVGEAVPARTTALGGEAASAEKTEEVAPASAVRAAHQPPATSSSEAGAKESRTADRWAKVLSDPAHTPELLALAAVESIGPRAREWASATMSAYPTATPETLTRLATRQFIRFGALTSVFGALAGSYAPFALVGTRALTDAELILHLAAARGLDPTDPRRAVDLLVITRVHESAEQAEAALAAVREHEAGTGGLSEAIRRLGRTIAPQAAVWAALRAVNRYYPGTSMLMAVLTSGSSAQTTAARATAYYRG